ncbi:MAG: hypothetical protein KAS17_06680 [Victivallaceae bacterium]|nr:hypothetical protein [Victivallaceae bacterium]
MQIPAVWTEAFSNYIENNLKNEAARLFRIHQLPDTLESWQKHRVAPRALKICNCLGDSNPTFFPSEMLRSYAEVRKVFQSYESDSQLAYQIFNKPHGYWPEIRETMLGWFDFHLKGIGHGAPKLEKDFECLPEEKLMVFKNGKRPVEVISIADYCQKRGAELKSASTSSGNKKSELKDILKFSELELKTTHKYADNSGWNSFALETTCGIMIPVLVRKPRDGSHNYVIATSSIGKADLVNLRSCAVGWRPHR